MHRTDYYIERILLFIYVLTMGCQLFADRHSRLMLLTGNLGWILSAAGIFVVAGYRAYLYIQGELTRRELISYAAVYYGLYVITGFGRFVIVDGGSTWDDLMRVVFLISIPKLSEIFFTAAALFLLTAAGKTVLTAVMSEKWPAPVLSLAGFVLVFFPQTAIRYPVFAMWIGGDCYRCIPLLVYFGYYLLGWRIAQNGRNRNKSIWKASVAGIVCTVLIFAGNRAHLLKKLEFPLKYWMVLLPAGVLLVFYALCKSEKITEVYEKISGRLHGTLDQTVYYLQTALWLLILHMVRGTFQVKKCSSLRTIAVSLLCWLFTVAVARLIHAFYMEGARKICGRHKKLCYIVLYTMGFVGVCSLVYLPFLENGVSLIWRRDAISQYFPKAIYFSKYIRELVHNILQGNFTVKLYDFSLGMGDGIPVKLEPLYWLHALFAPDDMERGYETVMLLRMYLSGLSISALLLYFKKNWKITWICSYMYCFSGYVLYACTRHAQFMVPFILLPLLVIAVEEILRRKRWMPGCLLIAVSLLCSYYFLYMNTIALAVYFLIRYACMPKEKHSWKNFWSYIGCFAGAYILGAGMGSMTIFTSLFNYFGSGRTGSGNISAESLLYYKKDWIHDIYMNLVAPGEGLGYWMKLGMLPVCLLAIVFIFLRKKHKELKICTGFCLTGLLFPFFAYFMSGFGSVTNRWLYIFILVVTLAVAEFLQEIPSLTKRETVILFFAIVPYFVLAMLYSRYDTVFFLKGLGMLLMTLLVVVLSTEAVGIFNRKQMTGAMTVLILMGLAVNGDMLFGANGSMLSEEYAAKGSAVEEAEGTKIKACTAVEDDSFYRVTEAETNTYNYCASSALGLRSISYFNSTMNGLILEFDQLMGNGRSSMVYQSDFNNRTMLNALASVKYYGALDDETAEYMLPYGYQLYKKPVIDDTAYAVYETEDTLPLAYSYKHVMTEDELLKHPVEERQELLLKNAVVDEDAELSGSYKAADETCSGYEIRPKQILLDDVVWENNTITGEDNGTVTFTLDPIPNAEIYFVFKGTTTPTVEGRDTTLLGVKSANGQYEYRIRPQENIYYMDFEKYMLNFGYSKEGLDSVTLQFWGSGVLNLEDWMLWCQPMDDYEAELSEVKAESLENIVMENNRIRGTISTETDKLLTFSVPYQKGWSAVVDGVKTPLIKTNIMYTGLEITPGEHEIVLQYEMPGVRYGMLVTVVSMIVCITICAGMKLRKHRKLTRR